MVVDSDLEKLYKLFQAIDKDGSGEIDFREFVVALWNYCTMGKSALTIFAFDLYDLDGSGEIELDEVECKKGFLVVYMY